MVSEEQFREILKGLLERSKRDEVNWQQPERGVFAVRFPHSVIVVKFRSPSDEPDSYEAALLKEKTTLAEIGTYVGEPGSKDDEELLRALYQEAQRSVIGWDKALEEIESSLKSEGRVGISSFDDDVPDVPF